MFRNSSLFKKIIIIFAVILILLGLIIILNQPGKDTKSDNNSAATISVSQLDFEIPEIPVINETPTKIIFVGDIMLDRNVEKNIYEHGKASYNFPFEKIASYLNKADLAVGNLETTISERGWPTRDLYLFRSKLDSINGLKFAGFDVLSVANNHSSDYARPAFEDTLNILKQNNIIPVGGGMNESSAYTAKTISVDGTKIAFLAFSDFLGLTPNETRSGVAITEPEERMLDAVQKTKADITIVMFHFGEEYQPQPNARQKELAEAVIDTGADLVVGHHPHVNQPLDQYKGKYIAYSLGNFVFDQYFSTSTMTGGVLEIEIKNQKINSANLRKVKLNKYYQPELIKE